MKTKNARLLLTFLLGFLSLTTSTTLRAADFIVGTVHFYPPFILSSSNNTYTGFDPAIMTIICQKLELNCVFKSYRFAELESALDKKEIDVAMAGINITFNRRQRLTFSIPYLPSNAQFIAHQKVAKSQISSVNLFDYRKELLDKRIGVVQGSTYERRLRDMLPRNRVVSYQDIHHAMSALTENSIDLVLTDFLAAIYWRMRAPNELALYGDSLPIGEGYGIAIAKDNVNLVEQINRQILNLQLNGDFIRLYDQFFSIHPSF